MCVARKAKNRYKKLFQNGGNLYMGNNRNGATGSVVKAGISFGTCLAIVISYTAWQSIPWAIFHGLLSWVYVIYYVIRY